MGSIGYLIEELMGVNKHMVVWGINILMLVLTFIFLEKRTFINTVIGSLLFPIVLQAVPEKMLLPLYPVALLIGSFLFSFGIYYLYIIGASNGGITIPPLILEKYFQLEKEHGILVTNLVIVFLNYLTRGLRAAVVSMVSIFLISFF